MRWRTKRKLVYTTLAVLPLFVVAAIIYAATFFPEPTCFDGEQNQNERGVDCGGRCIAVCQTLTPEVDVVWDRAFEVSDDIYNVAAYIENPNTDLIAHDVPYTFKVYDKNNLLITEHTGEITLLPQPKTVVFAGGIETGDREFGRAVFEFSEPPFWERASFGNVEFLTTNRNLTLSDSPTLEVTVTNANTRPVRNVRLVALVRDTNREVVHISRTVISSLDVRESDSIIFTWRQPFGDESGGYQTEIIPVAYELVE